MQTIKSFAFGEFNLTQLAKKLAQVPKSINIIICEAPENQEDPLNIVRETG
jgi:hypothetical protein